MANIGHRIHILGHQEVFVHPRHNDMSGLYCNSLDNGERNGGIALELSYTDRLEDVSEVHEQVKS